jgi:hypothetical protein
VHKGILDRDIWGKYICSWCEGTGTTFIPDTEEHRYQRSFHFLPDQKQKTRMNDNMEQSSLSKIQKILF